jgi:TldD protein
MMDALDATAGSLVGDLEQRFPYAAAVLIGVSGMEFSDNGKERTATELDPSRGVIFTVYDGRQLQELATSALESDALARAVRMWAAALRVYGDGPVLATGHAPGQGREAFATPTTRDAARIPLEEKLAYVADLRWRVASTDPRVQQAQALLRHETRESVYIGRGRHLEQRVSRAFASVFVMAVAEGRPGLDFLARGGTYGLDGVQMSDEDLAQLAEVALRLTTAGPIDPGEYDVVTDPMVSGTIAHESFGHGTELDLFSNGRARAARYVGKRVAAPGVKLVDDPSLPGGFGSYFFDDEGELATPTQILLDGIFAQPISDLASATQTSGSHTPNGRRQDYTRKVYARMSNTFFARGASDPTDMIAQLEHGIYLRKAESGTEDPMGWGVRVSAQYGEEIANGRLTGKVYAPVVITGYVPDLLQSISMVGNDFGVFPGTCGRWTKELLPVSAGGPHLRLRARLS